MDKSPALPSDIQWHFIGHLQSNKVKALLEGAPNLAMVETVDSEKLANKLDSTVAALGAPLFCLRCRLAGWARVVCFVLLPVVGEGGRLDGCLGAAQNAAPGQVSLEDFCQGKGFGSGPLTGRLLRCAGRPPLPVFVQVNTSGEETKHGVEPEACLPLARHIHEQCKHLRFAGLITIGMPGGWLGRVGWGRTCPRLSLI